MADIQNNEPVAYFYELTGVGKELVLDCNGEYARRLLEAGYTETPLFTRAAPPAMDREAVDAEVERIMAISDDEIMAEADADDAAWSRGFKQGLRTGQHASTVAALVKALEWYRDQVSRVRMVHSEGEAARNALDADCGRLATDALSTLSADAIRQGEGWRLVPTVMTPEMIEAWRSAPGLDCQVAYSAMLAATPAPAVDADEMPERDYSEGEELAIAIHNSMRFRALKNIQQVMRHLENITPANDLRGSIVGLLDALCLKVSENLPEASHIAAAQALSKPAVDAVADRQINTTRVDDREAAVGAECNLCHGLNTSCHDGCEIIHEAVDAVPVGEVVERLKETADDLRKIGWHEDRQNVLDAIAALSHGEGRK